MMVAQARRFWRWMMAGSCGLVVVLLTNAAQDTDSKTNRAKAQLQVVATFNESMPTGVTVSQDNRVFVNFPRWGDPVPFTVAEIKNGKATPFPDAEINRLDTNRAAETFVSVQSVVVDPRNRLWVLDTGSVKMEPVVPDGPKLVCIDLASNKVLKIIPFPQDVALPTTYLNDIRFDLRKGEGVAYITDSSEKGPNGIVVVDLGSGKSRRVLHDHPSTKAEPNFVPTIDGKKVMKHEPGKEPQPLKTGSDGIAISADGSRLYYCPLASRRLYSVPTAVLLHPGATPEDVGASVKDEGEKAASDGLESDSENRIYVTDYENNAVHRRTKDGKYERLVQDPRASWPDTLSVAGDGYIYFIANQLHRQPSFNNGKDLREKPYYLFRLRTDARPVLLK